jgi:hypothetical protein
MKTTRYLGYYKPFFPPCFEEGMPKITVYWTKWKSRNDFWTGKLGDFICMKKIFLKN